MADIHACRLSKVALNNNLTMILAMTTQEAGRYLETYKLCEPPPHTHTLSSFLSSSSFSPRRVHYIRWVHAVFWFGGCYRTYVLGLFRAVLLYYPFDIPALPNPHLAAATEGEGVSTGTPSTG